MREAVAYHDSIALQFQENYRSKPDFQERYRIWTGLLDNLVQPGLAVLDAGCGPGLFSFYLARKGCRVTGFDGAAAMIALSREQAADLPAEFLHLTLPLANDALPGPYDLVLSSSVLEYVPDLDGALAQFAHRLRPGGHLLVSLPNRRSLYRRLEKIRFRLTGRPRYLQSVHHLSTAAELRARAQALELEPRKTQYYAYGPRVWRLLTAWLPGPLRGNLFVTVFQKKNHPL